VDPYTLVLHLGSNDGFEVASRAGSVVVRVIGARPESSRTIRPFGAEIEVGAAVRLTAANVTVTRLVPEGDVPRAAETERRSAHHHAAFSWTSTTFRA